MILVEIGQCIVHINSLVITKDAVGEGDDTGAIFIWLLLAAGHGAVRHALGIVNRILFNGAGNHEQGYPQWDEEQPGSNKNRKYFSCGEAGLTHS